MDPLPLPRPQYVYIGPGGNVGEVHQAVYADPNEIITVSTTRAWLGTPEQFAKEFRHKS